MAEREPIDPRIFTPEYWSGHSPDDNCQWYPSRNDRYPATTFQRTAINKLGRETLRNYLNSAGRKVTRVFAEGEVFDGNKFPEGTIIKHNREDLHINNPIFKEPYKKLNWWGVICGYNSGDTRNLILMEYLDLPDGTFLGLGMEGDIIIRPGETTHKRFRSRDNQTEALYKINSVELHKMGLGVRRDVKEEKRSLIFSPLFGNPQPEAI